MPGRTRRGVDVLMLAPIRRLATGRSETGLLSQADPDENLILPRELLSPAPATRHGANESGAAVLLGSASEGVPVVHCQLCAEPPAAGVIEISDEGD